LKGTSTILWAAGSGELMSKLVIMVTSSRVGGHGSMTKEEAVQSVGPEIADGFQKVFIFIKGG